MKFNLKNRPKPPKFHNWRKIHRFLYEYHEWFEGFEKELREKWEKLDCESDLELGQSMIIREILGES